MGIVVWPAKYKTLSSAARQHNKPFVIPTRPCAASYLPLYACAFPTRRCTQHSSISRETWKRLGVEAFSFTPSQAFSHTNNICGFSPSFTTMPPHTFYHFDFTLRFGPTTLTTPCVALRNLQTSRLPRASACQNKASYLPPVMGRLCKSRMRLLGIVRSREDFPSSPRKGLAFSEPAERRRVF
jgi:hypothetical protein